MEAGRRGAIKGTVCEDQRVGGWLYLHYWHMMEVIVPTPKVVEPEC